ncbi:MAG: hypothetical protein P0Y53_22470 [Candidatus Pseudobacter hemicellulosilyticus]|uniref:T9SS type A sorting domain-containing protein n=1 Tax=Candidatus Pseudobacter hemicellulosilyticus TaxID=3121375 RepID=A0AAJ5WVR9_9BACT|nr:MAG: hypothetical protein P0Y53_22470 [Pseudobacter sp.]
MVRPTPFSSSFTLEVVCAQSKHTIVRLISEQGRILKMFSWYLIRGTNITSISDTKNLPIGSYKLDVTAVEGTILYSTNVTKEE